jgi:L-arabinose isomerase
MKTGCAAWILSGGAHHTCFSQNLNPEILQDFTNIAQTECIVIDKDTTLRQLQNELKWNEVYYQLNSK